MIGRILAGLLWFSLFGVTASGLHPSSAQILYARTASLNAMHRTVEHLEHGTAVSIDRAGTWASMKLNPGQTIDAISWSLHPEPVWDELAEEAPRITARLADVGAPLSERSPRASFLITGR